MLHEKRNGLTLAEMLMTMLISFIVMGTMVMLLRYGVLLMASNLAYTAAVRGAMSSVEMLSDGLIVAEQVQIISDDNHIETGLEAGLKDDWRYVVLNPDGKETRHIYIGEDGARVDEKVPGSEYIEDISFDTRGGDRKGGRLLRIFIRAAYGAADERKTVDLNRTILTHAADGVLGEWGEKAAMGRILRYKLRVSGRELDIYGSTNTASVSGLAPFNSSPDTWNILSKFDHFTDLDARLTLKLKTRREAEDFERAVEASDSAVTFTWIAADETLFEEDIVNSEDAKQNPKAIWNYLEERIPAEYWTKTPGWEVLKNEYGIIAQPGEETEFELPTELTEDPFNMRNEIEAKSRGFRLLAVTGGTLNNDATDTARRRVCVDVKPTIYERKLNLDVIADLYKGGSYMIAVASFPDSRGDVTKLPVYVKLENRKAQKGDPLWDDIIAELTNEKTTTTNDRTYENTRSEYGNIKTYPDPETNRRYLKVLSQLAAKTLIMLKLAPKDFAHMIPEDARAENIFYGVTNYAVYVNLKLSELGGGGGFGVLLNGSSVDIKPTNPPEYSSAGYVWDMTIGSNGFPIEYFGYDGSNVLATWRRGGARPMYFYDATKEKFPAPMGTDDENFNENAGAAPGASLNYRLPFAAQNRAQVTTIDFSAAQETRNGQLYITSANDYGRSIPNIIYPAASNYSPKQMQSWHNYSGTEIEDMLENGGGSDNRLGFRWDRSWHLQGKVYDATNGDTPENRQRTIWEQEHIIKLTVLEVTRNILAKEIEDEWRYAIHHSGGGVTGSDGNQQLTRLGDEEPIHKAGDIFVRAELIQLKKGVDDWYNSRYYVYSKPIWYGKFKGDAWRGDGSSPFKKLGNAMQHIVADPEPAGGDDQSFRRRGMRVRSWKEAFLGWDFGWVKKVDDRYQYVWRDFVNGESMNYNAGDPFGIVSRDTGTKKMPPDFFKTVYGANGQVNAAETKTAHSVWTPPIAIDMNNAADGSDQILQFLQSGDVTADTFGQYMYANQYVEREKKADDTGYYYNGKYSDNIYGRLSVLRPWRGDETSDLPNHTTPIFGLYAMRGWDYGHSGWSGGVAYDTPGTPRLTLTSKRFLRVVQGLQLPYYPSGAYGRNPSKVPAADRNTYKAERDRIFGIRFWRNESSIVSEVLLYDTWIGEGFSPREVRAILGLKPDTSDVATRGTYVYSNAADTPGQSALEKAGYYMPIEE